MPEKPQQSNGVIYQVDMGFPFIAKNALHTYRAAEAFAIFLEIRPGGNVSK